MSKSAMILCLNGKRRTVKFTPNMTISQILEDVCAKEKIDAHMYELRTPKTILDRTLPWRLTNLPNNAKLELCQSDPDKQQAESLNVRIALQLPNGRRLTGQFSTATFLSQIVEKFSEQLHRELNPKEGSVPAIVYMRQNFVGNQVLSSTSLRILGIIKDSALFRFFYQSPAQEVSNEIQLKSPTTTTNNPVTKIVPNKDNPVDNGTTANATTKHQHTATRKITPKKHSSNQQPASSTDAAMQSSDATELNHNDMLVTIGRQHNIATSNITTPQEIPPDLSPTSQRQHDTIALIHGTGNKSSESNPRPSKRKKSTPSTSSSRSNDLSDFKFPVETQGRQLYDQPRSDETRVDLQSPCDRNPKLFQENGQRNNSAVSDVADEFFEVTVDDLRKMMADLKHERKKFDDKDMLTEEQRTARKMQLMSRYPNIIIRIVFPDRQILQAVFRPLEKVEALYKFVKSHVTVSSFRLFTTPPKNILKNKECSLYDSNLAPAARVYFSTDDKIENNGLLQVSTLHLLCTNVEANLVLRKLRD